MPYFIGRGSGIRTRDPLLPKQVLYQAELCPDILNFKNNSPWRPFILKVRRGTNSESRPLSVPVQPSCQLRSGWPRRYASNFLQNPLRHAGGSASFVQRSSASDIRLVCARDAECEGLNLQKLGAQVNVDLPWNPSQLDWRIFYYDFAQSLIATARRLYADDAFGLDLTETVYALDATNIDLCLSAFPWAPFRSTKDAIKLHTLLDLRGNISHPSFSSATASSTTSNFSIKRCPSLGPSTRWIAATSSSIGSAASKKLAASLWSVPKPISRPSTDIPTRWTDRQDLDRGLGLCSRRDHQEASPTLGEPLRNPTDLEP
jgi:hypothetical protein